MPAVTPQPAMSIADLVRLVRRLPVAEGGDLVFKVVRETLEFLHVRVADILLDADRREQDLKARIAHLKGEIVYLEEEVARSKDETTRLEAAREEVQRVVNYLVVENRRSSADWRASGLPPPIEADEEERTHQVSYSEVSVDETR
jgi:hypothetical protein